MISEGLKLPPLAVHAEAPQRLNERSTIVASLNTKLIYIEKWFNDVRDNDRVPKYSAPHFNGLSKSLLH